MGTPGFSFSISSPVIIVPPWCSEAYAYHFIFVETFKIKLYSLKSQITRLKIGNAQLIIKQLSLLYKVLCVIHLTNQFIPAGAKTSDYFGDIFLTKEYCEKYLKGKC